MVEEGGFPAVGVADESHIDFLADFAENAFGLFRDGAMEKVVVGDLFGYGHDLHTTSLDAAQRHMSAHDLILNRVSQGGVADNLHFFTAHEAHLHQAVTETPVARDAHNHTIFAGFHIGERQHFLRTFVFLHLVIVFFKT